MSIVHFIRNHISGEIDEDVETELDDWKYPSVNLHIPYPSSESWFEKFCWLEDNVGDDNYYLIRSSKLGDNIARVFFTHSNDAMAFKLAYGYD